MLNIEYRVKILANLYLDIDKFNNISSDHKILLKEQIIISIEILTLTMSKKKLEEIMSVSSKIDLNNEFKLIEIMENLKSKNRRIEEINEFLFK